MNSTASKDWSKNSRNDTVANVSVIAAGMLAAILAAVTDFSESAPLGSQAAYQHSAGVRVAATATRYTAT